MHYFLEWKLRKGVADHEAVPLDTAAHLSDAVVVYAGEDGIDERVLVFLADRSTFHHLVEHDFVLKISPIETNGIIKNRQVLPYLKWQVLESEEVERISVFEVGVSESKLQALLLGESFHHRLTLQVIHFLEVVEAVRKHPMVPHHGKLRLVREGRRVYGHRVLKAGNLQVLVVLIRFSHPCRPSLGKRFELCIGQHVLAGLVLVLVVVDECGDPLKRSEVGSLDDVL